MSRLKAYLKNSDWRRGYGKLFVDTRSLCRPLVKGQWRKDSAPDWRERNREREKFAFCDFPESELEPIMCSGCQDVCIFIATDPKKHFCKRRCQECGVRWRAKIDSNGRLIVHEYVHSWTTLPLKPMPSRQSSDELIGRHLSWLPGDQSQVLSLRSRDSKLIPENYEGNEANTQLSMFYCIDCDFKNLWKHEEKKSFRERENLDITSVNVRDHVSDFDRLYKEFQSGVKAILDKLPGTKIVFRSSSSYGMHIYGFLERGYPSQEITRTLRDFLGSHDLLSFEGLDQRLHPCENCLRLPLGHGSILLNPDTLEPMFEGDRAIDQVKPALEWLNENEQSIIRVPLTCFRNDMGPFELPRFDPQRAIEFWDEGIPEYGVRRFRTKNLIALGRSRGYFGEELLAFINKWVRERHQGNSWDVNENLRRFGNLLAIEQENRVMLGHTGPKYWKTGDPGVCVPLPKGRFEQIAKSVFSLRLEKKETFTLIKFAFEVVGRAEYFLWLSPNPNHEVVFAYKIWRRIHERFNVLRQTLEDLGILHQSTTADPEHNRAAKYRFPILATAKDDERVGLHEGLFRLLGRRLKDHFSEHHCLRIRKRGREEKKLPRWGSGELIEQAIAKDARKARRRSKAKSVETDTFLKSSRSLESE